MLEHRAASASLESTQTPNKVPTSQVSSVLPSVLMRASACGHVEHAETGTTACVHMHTFLPEAARKQSRDKGSSTMRTASRGWHPSHEVMTMRLHLWHKDQMQVSKYVKACLTFMREFHEQDTNMVTIQQLLKVLDALTSDSWDQLGGNDTPACTSAA